MARVVVVGGGAGGMAAAARLAKLKHQVTLVECQERLGGALLPRERDGFAWDTVSMTLLPAALRDLFRKSGRPLEAELDLQHRPILREHRFEDGTALALPGSSRAAQLAAVDALGPGLGREYVDHVAAYSETWETLRRHFFEVPPADPLPGEVTALLRARESLHRRLRRAFRDPRLRLVAAHPLVAAGHDPRQVPAWVGLVGYLEQRFGGWAVGDGPGALLGGELSEALARRLQTRKVEVLNSTEAHDLVVRSDRVAAVRTSAGEIDADVVVVATDPRRLPALAQVASVRRALPAMPPTVVHLGLREDPAARTPLPRLDQETVLHGKQGRHADPLVIVRPGGQAPEDAVAWTVQLRGRLLEDPLAAMARLGLDVRPHVRARLDLSPRDLVEHWHGSPLGVEWQGRGTVRLGPRTPISGVYTVGAHAASGPGLPFVALSAAVVAQLVGSAE